MQTHNCSHFFTFSCILYIIMYYDKSYGIVITYTVLRQVMRIYIISYSLEICAMLYKSEVRGYFKACPMYAVLL